MNDKLFFEELPYGFRYGPATVERIGHDPKRGVVVISIESEHGGIDVHVSRSGKIRVYDREGRVLRAAVGDE